MRPTFCSNCFCFYKNHVKKKHECLKGYDGMESPCPGYAGSILAEELPVPLPLFPIDQCDVRRPE